MQEVDSCTLCGGALFSRTCDTYFLPSSLTSSSWLLPSFFFPPLLLLLLLVCVSFHLTCAVSLLLLVPAAFVLLFVVLFFHLYWNHINSLVPIVLKRELCATFLTWDVSETFPTLTPQIVQPRWTRKCPFKRRYCSE